MKTQKSGSPVIVNRFFVGCLFRLRTALMNGQGSLFLFFKPFMFLLVDITVLTVAPPT